MKDVFIRIRHRPGHGYTLLDEQSRKCTSMTAHHIRYDVDDEGIATVTIDRPEKRNAMTYAMLGAFLGRVAEAGADERVRVVIVTGAGGAFCAGTDLADLSTIPGETRGTRGGAAEGEKWWPLVRCPKPVIGAIDGYAVGMGAEFTSQCDVRIVSDRARFAWNFAHRGLVPDTGAGSWILPRLIGSSAPRARCVCSTREHSSKRRRLTPSAMRRRSSHPKS
jgi:enoyl-CoA hydratase